MHVFGGQAHSCCRQMKAATQEVNHVDAQFKHPCEQATTHHHRHHHVFIHTLLHTKPTFSPCALWPTRIWRARGRLGIAWPLTTHVTAACSHRQTHAMRATCPWLQFDHYYPLQQLAECLRLGHCQTNLSGVSAIFQKLLLGFIQTPLCLSVASQLCFTQGPVIVVHLPTTGNRCKQLRLYYSDRSIYRALKTDGLHLPGLAAWYFMGRMC